MEPMTEFLWAEYFMLYLTKEREEADPIGAYNLARQLLKDWPQIIYLDVEEVVNEYLERGL